MLCSWNLSREKSVFEIYMKYHETIQMLCFSSDDNTSSVGKKHSSTLSIGNFNRNSQPTVQHLGCLFPVTYPGLYHLLFKGTSIYPPLLLALSLQSLSIFIIWQLYKEA